MLCQFHVKNVGLMKDVSLNLKMGLTVFTGETGAGKSMLIDALGVLLGDRASQDLIRHGEEQACIEGILENLAPEIEERFVNAGYELEDGQLFLSRELNISGRNICRIQGRTVPYSLYRSLCRGLVDIFGQMDHQTLLNPDSHRTLLDRLGGERITNVLNPLNEIVKEYKQTLEEEQKLAITEAERLRREELLKYQIEEIEEIKPRLGEEEELNHEKKRLINAERILNITNESYGQLYEGNQEQPSVIDMLGHVRKLIGELVRFDQSCEAMLDQIDSAYYTIEELVDQLRNYQESFDFQPGRLDAVEERLIQLRRLKKYGQSVDEVYAYLNKIKDELDQVNHMEERMAQLKTKKEKLLREYAGLAQVLTQERKKTALFLERELMTELKSLGMENARFEVRFTPIEEPSIGGAENVEFYFSANLGEPPKPLAKVASGGEMARLMLALKSILSRYESVGTFIFDEVDSGVGGITIQKVGKKLSKIAEARQVFCITHSPAIAACGDFHYRIFKNESDGRTYTHVQLLSEQERIDEIARMLGGNGDIARKHAEELRKSC